MIHTKNHLYVVFQVWDSKKSALRKNTQLVSRRTIEKIVIGISVQMVLSIISTKDSTSSKLNEGFTIYSLTHQVINQSSWLIELVCLEFFQLEHGSH